MRTGLFYILNLLLLLHYEVFGQSCCSGGTPLIGNIGMQHLEKNEWYFRIGYDFNYINDLVSEDEVLEDDTRTRITQSLLWQSSYGITDRIGITVLLSYINEQQNTFIANGVDNRVSQSGLGDGFLLAQFSVPMSVKQELIVVSGLKIPFGKTNARGEDGILLPPDLQPGSGSRDFINGFSYKYFQIFGIPQFDLNATGGVRFSGKSSRFEGDVDYRFGNEFVSAVGLIKGFLLRKTTLTSVIQLSYRFTQADISEGFELPSTGGHWVNINPGLNLNPAANLDITIGSEIPVYRNLVGTQLTTSYRLNLGVSYRLKSSN
ncbi:hypothetical protein E9993_16915 [Labilibacter sediminis]|nr:hypothetical protein E9993_16915 [Labilibacter sediminis]